jgi:hypothetical protein
MQMRVELMCRAQRDEIRDLEQVRKLHLSTVVSVLFVPENGRNSAFCIPDEYDQGRGNLRFDTPRSVHVFWSFLG